MNGLKRIVGATDFSDGALQAIKRATLLAAEQRADLELLHVVNGSELDALREVLRLSPDSSRRLVNGVAEALQEQSAEIARRTGVNTAARTTVGDVLSEILAAANEADLLAIGAHGLNWVRDMILGTTAERLVGKCKSPILVARRAAERTYERVIVAVDFSSYSKNALRLAAIVAPHAEITAVHAFEVPFEGQLFRAGVAETEIQHCRHEARLRAVAAMRALVPEWSGARIRHVVEHGNAARLILTQEEASDAELIVVGKHGRGRVEEWLLGSVTRHVLADAKCDVLVAHKGGDEG